jgi:hypothetical protein
MTAPDMFGCVSRLYGGQCRNNAGFEQNRRGRDQIGAWRSCRRGTDMATPSKIPLNDNRPGRAMTALINLKLSANAQFQDNAGACKLIATAVARGDQSMAPRLSECHAG